MKFTFAYIKDRIEHVRGDYEFSSNVAEEISSELDRLRALNAQLVEALKKAQWGDHVCYEGGDPCCPICDNYPPQEPGYHWADPEYIGHKKDCLIGAALAAAEKRDK